MKHVRLLYALLTGTAFCTALTGCVTVTNHYPATATTTAPQPAPVHLAGSIGPCQCGMHASHSPYATAGSISNSAECHCSSCLASYSYLNPDGFGRNQPQIVYVPIVRPSTQQPFDGRTDADRTREIVDILIQAIDALQGAEGDYDQDPEAEESGNAGTASSGQPGRYRVPGRIALGGRAGSGGLSTGNPTHNPGGNVGGRATGAGSGSRGSNGSTGPGGRAPSSEEESEPVWVSATGPGTTGPVDAAEEGNASSESLPHHVAGSGGDVIADSKTGSTESDEEGSASDAPWMNRGGSDQELQTPERNDARTIPGTSGTQTTTARQTGTAGHDVNAGPIRERRQPVADDANRAPSTTTDSKSREVAHREEPARPAKQRAAESTGSSSSAGSKPRDVAVREEEVKPAKQKAAESSASSSASGSSTRGVTVRKEESAPATSTAASGAGSSTARQTTSTTAQTVATPPNVVSTPAPPSQSGNAGTVQTLPTSDPPTDKTSTGAAVLVGSGSLSAPR